MEPLSALVVYGPLGIWAATTSVALVYVYRELGRVRDVCAAETAALNKQHTEEIAALNEAHAEALASQQAAASAQAREQSERHERQMTEATQRSFAIMTSLADKMSTLADSITRNRR